MRNLVLALLTLALVLPTPSFAQEAGQGVRVLEDPAGDVDFADTGQPLPAGGNPYLDIRTLDVEERDEVFVFRYKTEGFPSEPEAPIVGSASHQISFRHNDATFWVFIWRQVLVQTPTYYASFAASYGGQAGGSFANLDIVVGDAGLLTFEIPRILLADAQGAPPFPGRVLEDFQAESDSGGSSICILECRELVKQKDVASSTSSFEVKLGVQQSGNARLSSATPYRATNGQAGTTIFEVQAANIGIVAETFDLAAVKVPANWKVSLPQTQVRLEPGATATFPVLLEIPFQHVHGRLQTFVVEMRSPLDAGTVGRVELGLQFVDPPQPAGHHPALFLHSHAARDELNTAFGALVAGNGAWASMNTLDKDDLDAGVPVSAQYRGAEGDLAERSKFQWTVPLAPGLRMGIDGDMAGLGAIRLPVSTVLPMDNAIVDGALIVVVPEYSFDGYTYWEEGTETTIATIPPTAAVSIGANGQAMLEGEVRPHPAGDLVPFQAGQQMLLVLNVTFDRPATVTAPEAPALLPGGTLTVPLLDYSDPVDQVLSTLSGLSLTAKDGQERRAPPDSTAVYTMELTGPAGEYRLAAYGANQEWVRFAEGESATVVDGVATLHVLIDVPADTPSSTVTDFVVEAAHREMLDARAVARLRLVADPTAPAAENVPDEVALESPSAAVALLGVALLAAAGSRRRVYP
jgi:hypothetical protein